MQQTEIRLLGPLFVRRADGSVVEPTEWRTTKTLQLLRLLAVDAGQPVAVATILDRLWPNVDDDHGRTSLRTAASQLRKALNVDCLERGPGSLLLRDVWVDVHAYSALLVDADRARRAGEHAQTVALVREAETLYVGDIENHDASEDWLNEVAQHWRARRCRSLVDAAEAAAAMHWMRDSLDLARLAFELEPESEQAARALMRALAGLGEMERALAVFDRVRHNLAEQFGVDPAPQTRALHLQLLTGTVGGYPVHVLAGHETAVDTLVSAIARLRMSSRGTGVVWLRGEPGSGRDAVVAAACDQMGLTLRNANRGWTGIPGRPRPGDGEPSEPFADVVVTPIAGQVTRNALGVLGSLVRRAGLVVVVPVQTSPWSDRELNGFGRDIATETVVVPPLSDEGLVLLVRAVLQGEPSPALLRTLRSESGSLAGVGCAVLRRWLTEGRIVWTPDGLDVRRDDHPQGRLMSGILGRLVRSSSPATIDALGVIAVADVDLTESDVEAVMAALHPNQYVDVPDVLDTLVDSGLLLVTSSGFRLRHRDARHEVVDWLRPGARRRVHGLVAERVALDPLPRVRHLLAAGKHQQACDAGVTALMQAYDGQDADAVQELVDVLGQLSPRIRVTASGQPLGRFLEVVRADMEGVVERRLCFAGSPAGCPAKVISHRSIVNGTLTS